MYWKLSFDISLLKAITQLEKKEARNTFNKSDNIRENNKSRICCMYYINAYKTT